MFMLDPVRIAAVITGRIVSLSAVLLICLLPFAARAAAQPPCGGDFSAWKSGLMREAEADGVGPRGLAVLAQARRDPSVIRMDRTQTNFTQSFLEFANRTVSGSRLKIGRAKLNQHAGLFKDVERRTGVPGPVIVAFWAMETDFGVNQGDFDTVNALATLAHDCRRPQLFRPQLISAARLVDRGVLSEGRMKGAWAGELGQVQVLPSDYLRFGVDADGDGRVNLKDSAPDAIATAGSLIRSLGWRPGEPWLEEVRVPPDLQWREADISIMKPRGFWAQQGVTRADGGRLPAGGLPAALLLPMGRSGPAFLAYPNFRVFLEWNESLVYTAAAAYFATRLAGAPPLRQGDPGDGLSTAEVVQLQKLLQRRGHNVGGADGVLGAGTRAAIKTEQIRHGLPADSWPTRELLARLQ